MRFDGKKMGKLQDPILGKNKIMPRNGLQCVRVTLLNSFRL